MNLDEHYCTPADACRILGILPHQIRGLVWDKKLAHERVGGRTMLIRSDVEALKAKGKVVVKPEPDAVEEQKKLQATYLRPPNQGDVNSAPGYGTQWLPVTSGAKAEA